MQPTRGWSQRGRARRDGPGTPDVYVDGRRLDRSGSSLLGGITPEDVHHIEVLNSIQAGARYGVYRGRINITTKRKAAEDGSLPAMPTTVELPEASSSPTRGPRTADLPDTLPLFTFDTLVVFGRADETNPLFIYANAPGRLLDDSTVVYGESPGAKGRLVVVNAFTGEGWQVESGRGAEGPGEFGAHQPLVSPWKGVVHAVAGPFYNAYAADGEVLSSGRFPPSWSRETVAFPVGIAGGRLVVRFHGRPTSAEPPEQTFSQGIRIYDAARGMVAEIRGGIPDVTYRVNDRGSGFRSTVVAGGGLFAMARGETIVWGMAGGRTLTTLDPHGEVVASRDLEHEVDDAFVDADGRVWATTSREDGRAAPIKLVMDRELNPLFRVAVGSIADAAGSTMMTYRKDDLGLWLTVLLRMRRR